MRIDPIRGAEIERNVHSAYQYALRDRWLDEADIEFMKLAINVQVVLLILDACLRNRVLLSEEGKDMFARAIAILTYCLQELRIENPYGGGKPN